MVVAFEDAFVATRPDDVAVHRIGHGKAGFAPAHVLPRADGNGAAGETVRGAASRAAVLPVAVDVVGNLVVGEGVVHLRYGQLRPPPGFAAVVRDADALIVADDDAIGQHRVNPDVVVVAAADAALDGSAAVERDGVGGRNKVEFVGVVGRNRHARVVKRALGHGVVAVDHAPTFAAVVAAPENALVVFQLFEFAVGVGFDQCIDPVRVRRGHRQADFPPRRLGKPLSLELRPGFAAVARSVKPAAGPAAGPAPGVDDHLPHPGEEDAGVVRVHDDVGGAGVLVHEENALPVFAAVFGAIDAALLLRAVGVTKRCDQNVVGVGGVDDDASDAPGLVEPHMLPGFARVGGAIDAVANDNVAADERFAGSDPDYIRIRGSDRQRADGRHRLVVEDGLPVHASVGGLEHTARGCPKIDGVAVARHARHRADAVPHRADVPVLEGFQNVRIQLLRRSGNRKQKTRSQ